MHSLAVINQRAGSNTSRTDNYLNSPIHGPRFNLEDIRRDPSHVLSFINIQIADAEARLASGTLYFGEDRQNLLQHSRLLLQKYDDKLYGDTIRRIQKITSSIQQIETNNLQYASLEDLFHGYNDQQINNLLSQTAVVQLSTGCSGACRNCNVNAIKQPRRHISFEALDQIFYRLGTAAAQNQVFLYYSSDPLDYKGESGENYFDVDNLIFRNSDYHPYVTTTVPRGAEEIARKLWGGDVFVRISISNSNIHRLKSEGFLKGDSAEEWEKNLGEKGDPRSHILHDCGGNNLLIPAGLSYDYRSVLQTIACRTGIYITPDGIYQFLATRTSPRSPNGYQRFLVTPDSEYIFKLKDTRQQSIPILQPLDVVNFKSGGQSKASLLDDQIFQALYLGVATMIDWMARRTEHNQGWNSTVNHTLLNLPSTPLLASLDILGHPDAVSSKELKAALGSFLDTMPTQLRVIFKLGADNTRTTIDSMGDKDLIRLANHLKHVHANYRSIHSLIRNSEASRPCYAVLSELSKFNDSYFKDWHLRAEPVLARTLREMINAFDDTPALKQQVTDAFW